MIVIQVPAPLAWVIRPTDSAAALSYRHVRYPLLRQPMTRHIATRLGRCGMARLAEVPANVASTRLAVEVGEIAYLSASRARLSCHAGKLFHSAVFR